MNPTKPDAGVEPHAVLYIVCPTAAIKKGVETMLSSVQGLRKPAYIDLETSYAGYRELTKLPATPAAAGDGANELHRRIMNLPTKGIANSCAKPFRGGYKEGCRDTRHAAAELVLQLAPSTALQDENRRLRETLEIAVECLDGGHSILPDYALHARMRKALGPTAGQQEDAAK